jgi:hypothetical protein
VRTIDAACDARDIFQIHDIFQIQIVKQPTVILPQAFTFVVPALSRDP